MLIRRLSAVSITSGLSVESGPMLSGCAPMARAEEDVDVDRVEAVLGEERVRRGAGDLEEGEDLSRVGQGKFLAEGLQGAEIPGAGDQTYHVDSTHAVESSLTLTLVFSENYALKSQIHNS